MVRQAMPVAQAALQAAQERQGRAMPGARTAALVVQVVAALQRRVPTCPRVRQAAMAAAAYQQPSPDRQYFSAAAAVAAAAVPALMAAPAGLAAVAMVVPAVPADLALAIPAAAAAADILISGRCSSPAALAVLASLL